MSVTDEELLELLDRRKCYDVLTRYCRGLDRADLDLIKSAYWEDAVDQHGIYEGNAHEFCDYIIAGIGDWFEVATHNICNIHMDYYGDVMCTESYLISYCSVAGDADKVEAIYGPAYVARCGREGMAHRQHAFLMAGRYLDRLEKREGEWRIARRQVVMDWNENWPGGLILDEGMFRDLQRRGCYGPEDPVYANRPGG